MLHLPISSFRTLVNPDSNSKGSGYSTDYRVGNQRPFGPGGGPQRRMGGFRRGGGKDTVLMIAFQQFE